MAPDPLFSLHLSGIGLIVVDEEHDTSYKQEGALRYNARDIAIVRAQQQNAVALLGSATPSVQSYHNTMDGKYKLVKLTRRVEQQELPEITIVDLCRSRDQKGWQRYFSKDLMAALRETMARNEQAILFLNRRGFANFPVCASCGKAIQCKNCDITLTFHQKHNAYKCHYCGFAIPSASHMPVLQFGQDPSPRGRNGKNRINRKSAVSGQEGPAHGPGHNNPQGRHRKNTQGP